VTTGAEALVAEVSRALPNIKCGSLVVFGDIFGGRIDNIHTIVGAAAEAENCAVLHFDQNETLRVWNPDGIRVASDEFRVERASRVRWEWFYYGRPQTPDNLYFREHRAFEDHVEASSNVDWYTPTFAPSRNMAAVQLLSNWLDAK
jgi:hypothetical protein